MPLGDLVHHRLPLVDLRLVDLVVVVGADHRPVGRDLDHRHLVDLHELVGLGQRRAGHAAELVVEAEVVLKGDRREGLVLLSDPHPLLGLDRLVQALGPAPPLEDPARELVDDLHLAVDHRVVVIAPKQRLGLQRLDQVVDEGAVLGDVEVLDADELLRLGDPTLGRGDGLVLLVVLVVVLGLVRALRLAHRLQLLARRLAGHLLRQAGERVVEVGRLLGGAGDDQRRPRLVDEDVVDLVDDREGVSALDRVLQRDRHVVAEVVEAELGVGPVDDVAGVLRVARARVVAGLDHSDGDAEGVVERLHPLGVAAGQVVVHRHQVDGVAGEAVEEDREGRRQRLALAGAHLGDRPVVEHHAADQLDVEVALAERAPAGLAAERERLGEQVVERLAVTRPLAQGIGVLADLGVLEQLHLGLEAVDRLDPALVVLELARLAHAKRAVDYSSAGHLRIEGTGRADPAGSRFAARRHSCSQR